MPQVTDRARKAEWNLFLPDTNLPGSKALNRALHALRASTEPGFLAAQGQASLQKGMEMLSTEAWLGQLCHQEEERRPGGKSLMILVLGWGWGGKTG